MQQCGNAREDLYTHNHIGRNFRDYQLIDWQGKSTQGFDIEDGVRVNILFMAVESRECSVMELAGG
jgi:hypothetical protein